MSASRTAAVGLGIVVVLESLRVWLPSILLVYGRAGTTPATEMGAFAAIPFVVAGVTVVVVRIVGRRRPGAVAVLIAAASLLAVSRIAVQATDGRDPQLWLSTAAVFAGLSWLIVVAGCSRDRAAAALGVVGGLAVDALLHGALSSTDLVWREGAVAWAATVVIAGAFLVATVHGRAGDQHGSASGWLALGPALVLHGILTGLVSRLVTISGWGEPASLALLAAGHGLAVMAAVAVLRGVGRAPQALVALLVAGFFGVWTGVALLTVAGHVALTAALGGAVAAALGAEASGSVRQRPTDEASGAGRAVAAWGGLLVFLVAAFLYYARYDMALPMTAPVVLAVPLGVVAAAAWRPRVAALPLPRPRTVLAGVVALVLVAGVGGALVWQPAPAAQPADPPLRMMTYNLQFGYDVDGRHSLDRVVDAIAAEDPDIIGLQEVSRGWLVNGGIDVLAPLAARLGMQAVFAPASDEVWGNAVLTRLPVADVETGFLPRGGAPMRRGYLAVVIESGGQEIVVINTHLHHIEADHGLRAEQVRALDSHARRLAAERPVVVMGDLNAEPGAPELSSFEEWLQNPLTDVLTWPSWDPDRHIDHILLGPGLVGSAVSVGATTASDHLPVAVTVSLSQ